MSGLPIFSNATLDDTDTNKPVYSSMESKKLEYYAPVYSSIGVNNGKIEVTFDKDLATIASFDANSFVVKEGVLTYTVSSGGAFDVNNAVSSRLDSAGETQLLSDLITSLKATTGNSNASLSAVVNVLSANHGAALTYPRGYFIGDTMTTSSTNEYELYFNENTATTATGTEGANGGSNSFGVEVAISDVGGSTYTVNSLTFSNNKAIIGTTHTHTNTDKLTLQYTKPADLTKAIKTVDGIELEELKIVQNVNQTGDFPKPDAVVAKDYDGGKKELEITFNELVLCCQACEIIRKFQIRGI